MSAFRSVLIVFFLGLGVYTVLAVSSDGMNFLTPFLGAINAVGWQGQFNLDFAGYLVMAAFWIAWRHNFSKGGLLVAAMASVGGMMVVAPYLLVAVGKAQGDAKVLLLGEARAAA